MSRTNLLLNVKNDLENLAADLAELASLLEQPQSTSSEESTLEYPRKSEIELKDIPPCKELAKKSNQGYSDEIHKLLKAYNAEKLSDIDPKD